MILLSHGGWSQLEKTVRSGVLLFRGALRGENLFSSLCATGDWVKKGSYHTAWSVPCDSSCTCSYAYGRGPAVGPQTGKRCWPLLAGVWRATALQMKPWCAEGDVPTAANLNLYRGWKSCVGWHCDDEPLFGKCGDAKLIVSLSFDSSALFRWRRQSCSDGEGHLCWLGHNVTFRWIKQHASSCPFLKAGVASCLPTCAQGSSVPNTGNLGYEAFWVFWFLLCALCIWGVVVLVVSLLCTRLGLLRCASCWTRPLGEGRWVYYLCNLLEEHLKIHKKKFYGYLCGFMEDCIWKPYVLASAGQPSLHGYDACMVYLVNRAFRRTCRQNFRKTSFSPIFVFLFSQNSTVRFWGFILWYLWIGRARHPEPPSHSHHVGVEVLNVGGWLTHGDLALEAGVDFLAVVEHRLIPARVRSEWARLRSERLASFGRQLVRILPMLVMLLLV